MDSENFVKSLEMEEQFSRHPPTGENVSSVPCEVEAESWVVADSLMSFTSEVKSQQKQDLINSIILSKLATDKQLLDNDDPLTWYDRFTSILKQLGWVFQKSEFQKYKSSQDEFKISDVVLELTSELVEQDEELVKVVKGTIDCLEKSKDGLKLFDSNSISEEYSKFQILACTVDKSGQINVAFLGSFFKYSESAGREFFFVTVKKEDVALFTSAAAATLDDSVYAQVRAEVKKKLGDRVKYLTLNLDKQ